MMSVHHLHTIQLSSLSQLVSFTLIDLIKLDEIAIPTKIKDPASSSFISYYFLLAFTSNSRYHFSDFLELDSTLSNDFSFFTVFTQNPHPLNGRAIRSLPKCIRKKPEASLKNIIWYSGYESSKTGKCNTFLVSFNIPL